MIRAARASRTRFCSKIGISEDRSEVYYDTHMNEFTTPPSVTLREILVAIQSGQPRRQRWCRRCGQDARRGTSRAGHHRQAAVRETRVRVVGFAVESQRRPDRTIQRPRPLSPELRKLIETMKIGSDVSQPIRTSRGFQLFKLESRTDTHDCRSIRRKTRSVSGYSPTSGRASI